MKLDLEMREPAPVPTKADPFALGYRYDADGEMIPLTEDDLVYPEEEDFVVNNTAHIEDRDYLHTVFKARVAGRTGLRVLGDTRIDFGVKGLKPLGPDVIVFNGEPTNWNPTQGTFPVKQLKARPLIAIELTSPGTRRVDLVRKPEKYFKAGVPLYVLIDLPWGGGKRPAGIVAFQAGPSGYEELPPEANGRVWLEVVEVFLGVEDERVACYDPDGNKIPDYVGLTQETEKSRAKAAKEARRAGREKKRADAEKARADENARKLAELEAELKRLRGESN